MKKSKLIFVLVIAACSACNSTEKESKSPSYSEVHIHDIVHMVATQSTCSSQGYDEHYKCQTCGAVFVDQNGEVPYENLNYYPLLEHEFLCRQIDDKKHEKYCLNCDFTEVEDHKFETAEGTKTKPGHIEANICICDESSEYVTSLPIIKIKTNNGQEIEGDRMAAEYYESTISVENCESKYAFSNLPGKVKVRGNYSANFDKKPYRIKFDSKHGMLGMNNEASVKNWVLLAEWKDRAMVRSMSAFYLGNEIYGPDNLYTTDYRYVKVYLNGKYKGVYGLAEQQEINKDRVNITKCEDDYTNTDIGYLVEMDANWNKTEDPAETFNFDYLKKNIKYLNDNTDCAYSRFEDGYTIKSDFYSEDQKNFIANRIKKTYELIYDTIYTSNGEKNGYYTIDENNNLNRDKSIKSSFECIDKAINIQSFVDTFILNEIMCDMDYAHSSFYLSFDNGPKGDKKLTLQAPWDWDSSLGYYYPHYDRFLCCDSLPKDAPYGNVSKQTNPWLLVLTHTNWFWQYVNNKFNTLKQANVFNKLTKRIDKIFSLYKNDFNEEFETWPKRESYSESTMNPVFKNLKRGQPHIDFVKKYISDRVSFLDKNIPIRLNQVK